MGSRTCSGALGGTGCPVGKRSFSFRSVLLVKGNWSTSMFHFTGNTSMFLLGPRPLQEFGVMALEVETLERIGIGETATGRTKQACETTNLAGWSLIG